MSTQERLGRLAQAVRPPTPTPPSWLKGYAQLRQRAEAAWQEEDASLRIVVSSATCANSMGAEKTLAILRDEVSQRSLQAQVGIGGCWGLCFAEPTALVAWPDGRRILYGGLSPHKAPRLGEALSPNDPCRDLALGTIDTRPTRASGPAVSTQPTRASGPSPTGQDSQGIRSLSSLPFWTVQERRLMANCGVIDPGNIDHYVARGG